MPENDGGENQGQGDENQNNEQGEIQVGVTVSEWTNKTGTRRFRENPATGKTEELRNGQWGPPNVFNPEPVPPNPGRPPSNVNWGPNNWTGMDDAIKNTTSFLIEHEDQIRTGVIIAGVLILAATAFTVAAPVVLPAVAGFVTELAEAAILRTALTSGARLTLGGGGLLLANGAFAQAQTLPQQGDPLLLDLNGDGIKATNFSNGVFFDYKNDGFAEWTTWVDPNDGMLVADLNNNGIIDNGTELLGSHTVLPNGSSAYDGYAPIAAYDSNGDGVVDGSNQKMAA